MSENEDDADDKIACRGLLLRLPDEPYQDPLNEELLQAYNDIKVNLGDIRGWMEGDAQNDTIDLPKALSLICIHVDQSLDQRPDWAMQLLVGLADTSKDLPYWRRHFGLKTKLPESEHARRSNPDSYPDCVLEVARRSVVLFFGREDITNMHVKSALRIIANCCADDNRNRSLMLHRGGIDALLRLASGSTEMNTVIPSLFNVCVGYDEPATIKPEGITPATAVSPINSDKVIVTATEQALGRWRSGGTTTNALLDLLQHGGEEYLALLAELIEMSAKPAVLGLSYVFGDFPIEKFERHCFDTFTALTGFGSQIARCCPEARPNLYRAAMAFLSQPEAVAIMMDQDHNGLYKFFFFLPYGDKDEPEYLKVMDDPTERETLLRMLYQVCAAPAFLENYDANNDTIGFIISDLQVSVDLAKENVHTHPDQKVFDSLYPEHIASAFVVLAAITTSEERAMSLLTKHKVLEISQFFLSHHESNVVSSTILQFVNRLSLSESGAARVFSYETVESLLSILKGRKGSLDVQREVVYDLRTIMRGSLERAKEMLEDRVLHTLREHFDHTIDGSMKLEIGQFMVEFCRIVRSGAKKNRLAGSIFNFWHGSDVLFEEIDIIEPVKYLFTDGQQQSQQDEGLLGLALIARQPLAACEKPLRKCLNEPKVLEKFLEIGKIGEGPAWENLQAIIMAIEHTPKAELPEGRLLELTEISERMGLQLVDE